MRELDSSAERKCQEIMFMDQFPALQKIDMSARYV